jgi:hypothetical protein
MQCRVLLSKGTGGFPFLTMKIIPHFRGGPDDPSSMQWQTTEEAKAEDKSE